MRIICSGDRNWTDYVVVRAAMQYLNENNVIIHGDNGKIGTDGVPIKGLDKIAGYVAAQLGLQVDVYPADWSVGLWAGPVRNKRMLVEGRPDAVWAFHDDLSRSAGTLDMITQAQRAGLPVTLYTTHAPPSLLHYRRRDHVAIQPLLLPQHPGTCDCSACDEAYGPRRKPRADA